MAETFEEETKVDIVEAWANGRAGKEKSSRRQVGDGFGEIRICFLLMFSFNLCRYQT